jgi:CTD kinase subunit alpha
MAALRRAQDIDQWRPEDSSNRDRERPRERPRERINDTRASSPRAARDSSRHRAHDTDTRPSTKHARGHSRERSLSRERTRRRSRSISREDRFRGSRREASADRVAHSRRHHHHHHRDTTPSSKRYPSRSSSPKGSAKRVKRQRSRSIVRSRSRTRRAESTHRPTARAYSPRPQRADRDRPSRRPTPDTYIPPTSIRRRSPSPDTHYRPAAHRVRKRSVSPDSRSRREISPRRLSPRRSDRRPVSPFHDPRDRAYKPTLARDRERSRSRATRRARSRSPPRRRSPAPIRRGSPPKRARLSPRRSRSPRAPLRRRPSRSPSPTPKARPHTDKGAESNKSTRANKSTSRKGSPGPASGNNSDTSKGREDDKMRGAYQYQGRGGFQQSPPYPPQNQYSPQDHSPYQGGRGGWNGQPYPNQGLVTIPGHMSGSHANCNRSPMQGFSPNQSTYHQNQSPGYYQNQQFPQQPGFNSPHRGGHGGFRGTYSNGPDRRLSGPGATAPFVPGGRGRGAAPTQFSNLSWTPASGTRGGRPATEAPRPQPAAVSQAPVESTSVDADDNPFRPSKDLRVEDEGPKDEKKKALPTKPSTAIPTAPKSGFGFSLKTKNPVPPASKAKVGLEEPEKPEPSSKESLLDPRAKAVALRESSRYSDSRSDRDRDPKDRDYDRDRDTRERDRRYDDPYDRNSAYRDSRDRDARDVRDPRDAYYRDRERDYRDPRDRDTRDPRDVRDVRDRDHRDPRDPRDPRDIRDRREPFLPRRPDSRPDTRPGARPERRTPPPQVPKTKIIMMKRMKPRPTLVPEHSASESVYYRKPGNESVVGSGTYGKVFKGIHVYTKDMVALKKIRMEGERDGVSIPDEVKVLC